MKASDQNQRIETSSRIIFVGIPGIFRTHSIVVSLVLLPNSRVIFFFRIISDTDVIKKNE